jgi:general secretion pathway protein F
MPVFQYKALDQGGKAVQGLREADSPRSLRAALRRDGVFLTEVLGEQAQRDQQRREVNVRRFLLGRVGPRDLAVATRQLAVLVRAGVPLVDALTALVEQVEHERLKRTLGDVKQRVNEGASLADALAAHPRVFSTLYVNMIRAGESSPNSPRARPGFAPRSRAPWPTRPPWWSSARASCPSSSRW